MKLYNEVMVCYDIEDNKIRTRLFGRLKDLGLRPIQKSVFWGHLNAAEERAVLRCFRDELDKATDRAFLVRAPLAEAAERNSFGYELVGTFTLSSHETL
jgi:CRISPR-associated protein Cas2